MINNETKDRVLSSLCNLQCFESMIYIDLKELLSETDTTFNVEALEFYQKGGFQMQDEILRLNLEKLKLEVEQLSKDYPEKALTFSSILSNISTVLGLFISK